MWLLYAFSGPVLWALSTHIDKYLVDRYFAHSDTAVLMVFTALLGALALPPIAWADPDVLRPPGWAIGVMALSGILYMGALLFYLRAIQATEASVIAPLFQTSTLFSVFLAWLLLREALGWRQLAGVGLIFAGVVALSLGPKGRGKALTPGVMLLMLCCGLAVSLSAVLFKLFALKDDFWVTTFWNFAGEALFGLAILAVPRYRRQFAGLFRRHPGAVIGLNGANELINLGGGLGVRFASLSAPVALVSAISSTVTLFVFAFGVLLTLFWPGAAKEDLSAGSLARKAMAALLVSAGVLLGDAGAGR
jgi:drug/metabolite transporter (DMT)-like permease